MHTSQPPTGAVPDLGWQAATLVHQIAGNWSSASLQPRAVAIHELYATQLRALHAETLTPDPSLTVARRYRRCSTCPG